MPIDFSQETSEFLFLPNKNQKLARYFDLPKFLSLIQTKNVFFNSLSKFEDPYEGTFPKHSHKDIEDEINDEKFYETYVKNNDEKLKYIQSYQLSMDRFYELSRNLTFVSCWNKIQSESYALWKIYAGLRHGIMIKTNIDKITKAFSNSPEIVHISEVKYVDFNIDKIPVRNPFYTNLYKSKPYSFENEVRLIYQLTSEYDEPVNIKEVYEQNKSLIGKNIKVDIDVLIEEIIISPFAPTWFYDVVKNIVDKYEININVQYSEFK